MRTRIAVPLIALAVLVLSFLMRPAISTAARPAESFSAVPYPSLSALPTPSRTPVSWFPADCATGSLGAAYPDQGHVLVPATITNCGTWKSKATFTVVVFYPGSPPAFALATNLRAYAAAGPAQVIAVLQAPPDPGHPVGLCLMRTVGDRVACARVETGDDHVTTATPIAVGDPLVATTVVYVDDSKPQTPQPFCGTCLGMPAAPAG